MSNSKYYVSVFGAPTIVGQEDKKAAMAGELIVFDYKKEVADWLNENRARLHPNDALAGKCLLELDDGRTAVVVRGVARALKTKVSIF